MINVIAIITAKPGKRDEVLANFKANVPSMPRRAASSMARRSTPTAARSPSSVPIPSS